MLGDIVGRVFVFEIFIFWKRFKFSDNIKYLICERLGEGLLGKA